MEEEILEETTELPERDIPDRCEFCFKDDQGDYTCPREGPYGVIRSHSVCQHHFKEIRRDNIRRINKEEEIPEDLSLLKLNKNVKRGMKKNENPIKQKI
jgi:hypothetical protein